jgi:hypothetical protein
MEMAVFWVVAGALMMEATSSPETYINFYRITLRNNPEDSHLHTRRLEDFRSYISWHAAVTST